MAMAEAQQQEGQHSSNMGSISPARTATAGTT
jgi:hypothetical protein